MLSLQIIHVNVWSRSLRICYRYSSRVKLIKSKVREFEWIKHTDVLDCRGLSKLFMKIEWINLPKLSLAQKITIEESSFTSLLWSKQNVAWCGVILPDVVFTWGKLWLFSPSCHEWSRGCQHLLLLLSGFWLLFLPWGCSLWPPYLSSLGQRDSSDYYYYFFF